jgi:hypothetical protein
MTEAPMGALTFILRVVDFTLYLAVLFSRIGRLARYATGSDKIVAVPAELKVLPPAAQHRVRSPRPSRATTALPSSTNMSAYPSNSFASHAANGTFQAS